MIGKSTDNGLAYYHCHSHGGSKWKLPSLAGLGDLALGKLFRSDIDPAYSMDSTASEVPAKTMTKTA